MVNLLPLLEKKKLVREYRLRLGIVVLCFIFALEIFSLVLFAPAYYALDLNGDDLVRILSEKQALTPKEGHEPSQMIVTIEKQIALLNPSAGIVDVPVSVLLQEVIAQKPQGIALHAFAYKRTADAVNMEFSGTALTQEDLLVFRRNVKANPRTLDFKYANNFITKKADINFSATVTFQ